MPDFSSLADCDIFINDSFVVDKIWSWWRYFILNTNFFFILQQTRVFQGLPYYLKFTNKYLTVSDLAAASLEEVLRDWQGLGYYSRARNIHRAAVILVDEYHGHLPTDIDSLQKIPGIGRYTVGAICSIAFNLPVPVVDGNVIRVLSRIFLIKELSSTVRIFAII